MKTKTLCAALTMLILAALSASSQTITRCGGPTNALSINWPMFHFDECRTGNNPYEHTLSSNNVGNLVWDWWYPVSAFTDKSIISSPVLVNGVLYITSQDGNLFALNASSGTLLWEKNITVGGDVAVANSVLYVSSLASNDGDYVYALDAATGTQVWQYTTPYSAGSPVVADGIVYVNISTSLYALNTATGAVIWHQTTGGSNFSPTVVNGIVYTGSARGTVYGLNARTGAILWQTTAGTSIASSPAIVNGTVYLTSFDNYYYEDGSVFALDALTGEILWKYQLYDTVAYAGGSPAVANGVVYVDSDAITWAFDTDTGALRWSYLGSWGYGQSAPAVANGVVYFGGGGPLRSTVRSLFALSADTGAVLWQYDFQSYQSNLSAPAVANGELYIGTGDGYLYAFHLPSQ